MARDQPPDPQKRFKPQKNDVWIDDEGELFVFDGDKWVLYEDSPDDLAAEYGPSEPPSLFR